MNQFKRVAWIILSGMAMNAQAFDWSWDGLTGKHPSASSASTSSAATVQSGHQEEGYKPELPESVKAERVIAESPEDRDAHLTAAQLYIREGSNIQSKREAAKEHLAAILSANPNDEEALLLFGLISIQDGKPDSAATYYRRAITANKNSLSGYMGLGDALTRQGDEKGASDAFDHVRQLQAASAPKPTNTHP